MLKVALLFVLACGFVACNEDDIAELIKGDPIALPVGNYTSACEVDGSISFISALEVQSQTTIVIQDTVYTDTECMVGGAQDAADTLTIEVADFSFAGQISYFTTTAENLSTAYFIEDGKIYISESKAGINEENIASSFSQFVKAPKDNADTVFTPVSF